MIYLKNLTYSIRGWIDYEFNIDSIFKILSIAKLNGLRYQEENNDISFDLIHLAKKIFDEGLDSQDNYFLPCQYYDTRVALIITKKLNESIRKEFIYLSMLVLNSETWIKYDDLNDRFVVDSLRYTQLYIKFFGTLPIVRFELDSYINQ